MRIAILLFSCLLIQLTTVAQNESGKKERIKIHSKALEGNLIEDPADRDVTVYLPPSYQTEPNKRFPVLYMLHGFTDNDSKWFGWEEHWINLHEVLDAALQDGLSKEMIVVMPNAYNRFKGSMYSSSATIGDWETFVSKELVDFVDENYRSIPRATSRGLAGHSMGGYGTIRLGMKYPEVWSAIYLLSPCCMDGGSRQPNTDFVQQVKAVQTPEQIEAAGFGVVATLATSAAFAPNPDNPPFFLDLPFDDTEIKPEIAAKIAANRTLNVVDQYIFNLRQLSGIAMDAGTEDRGIHAATKKLHEVLDSYDLPHMYESYEGDHLNRIAERIRTKALPFFSEKLVFK